MLTFELRSANIGERDLPEEKAGMEDEIIEMVVLEKHSTPPPPPPPPPPPEPEVIEVVDDKIELKEEAIVEVKEVDQEIEIFEEPEAPVVERNIYCGEKQPSFPGGDEKLFEYLGNNIKYPQWLEKLE